MRWGEHENDRSNERPNNSTCGDARVNNKMSSGNKKRSSPGSSTTTTTTTVDAALRALPLVARLATTRDCFGSLMLVSRPIRVAALSYIEHARFPEGTDDDTILRVLEGSPHLRDVKLYCSVGYAPVERAVTRLARLKKLHVTRIGVDDLQVLPQSLCDCTRLKSLSVSATALREMPELMGQISSLAKLDLSGCKSLAALPESTAQLTSIATLNLDNCRSLAALPLSIGQLMSLVTLMLSICYTLAALPESISQLSTLTTLNLSSCRSPAALPESTGQLSSLTTLNLLSCYTLAALPESTGQLSSLATLDRRGCLAPLPESISQLTCRLLSYKYREAA
jgi:Leucine-rich repeat (LRR) protein